VNAGGSENLDSRSAVSPDVTLAQPTATQRFLLRRQPLTNIVSPSAIITNEAMAQPILRDALTPHVFNTRLPPLAIAISTPPTVIRGSRLTGSEAMRPLFPEATDATTQCERRARYAIPTNVINTAPPKIKNPTYTLPTTAM
jgi:hypothetical protein